MCNYLASREQRVVVMRDGSTVVQWDGRRHVVVFIRSLHLLDLDLLEDWPGLSEHTFTPRAVQQNLQQRVKGVEWALFRLFELYSPTEARDKLRPFFPPLTSLQSVNFRAALLRALTELKKNGVLPREIVLRKTMLDECKGDRLEELLAVFSMLVLRKTVSRSAASPPSSSVSERVLGLSAVSEAQCVPLILACRGSLQQVLRQRGRVEEEAKAKKAELEHRALILSQRKARALEQPPAVDPLERGRVVELLKDEWTGDGRWINAMIYESIQDLDDDRFGGEHADGEALLHDLNRRLQVQQERLARWRTLEKSLPSQAEHMPAPSPAKLASTAKPYSFKQHQSIHPRIDNEAGNETNDNGVRDEPLLAPFAAILHRLDSELASQSQNQTSSPSPLLPSSGDVGISAPKQEPEKAMTPLQKAPASEFSWLDESETRLRDNDYSLPSQPSQHSPSFTGKARRSQAQLFSSDDGFTSDVPEASSSSSAWMPAVEKKSENGAHGATATPPQPVESKGTLLERTRQSIAAFNAKPRPETKTMEAAAKHPNSKIFPTNPFETPGRWSGGSGSGVGGRESMAFPEPSSNETTPRDQLFSDEAESASIFKSRPKLAQSPPTHRPGDHDDSVLAGEMTILDIGNNDTGYGNDWAG